MANQVNTGGLIAAATAAAAALVAGWRQWRSAVAAAAPATTTAIGTEYARLVEVLQGEVDRLRIDIASLRAECEERDARAQLKILQLQEQVAHLERDSP